LVGWGVNHLNKGNSLFLYYVHAYLREHKTLHPAGQFLKVNDVKRSAKTMGWTDVCTGKVTDCYAKRRVSVSAVVTYTTRALAKQQVEGYDTTRTVRPGGAYVSLAD